jgi:hypothetical protein
MDPAVKTNYNIVLFELEEIVEVFTPVEYSYQIPYDLCHYCNDKMTMPIKRGMIYRDEELIKLRREWEFPWLRPYAHLSCLDRAMEEKMYFNEDYLYNFEKIRNDSAQALLLLQELGLPWDVAWPIAAAAYWLL